MRRLTISLFGLVGFLFCFNGTSFAAATASLMGTDTTTQGNWGLGTGTYGTVGYYIPSGPSATPSDGSSFNPGAASLWTWGMNVASTGALKTGTTTNIASCWYDNVPGTVGATLVLNVKIPGGQSQTVAVYLQDYDKKGRAESVSITDPNNGNAALGLPIAVSGTNFVTGEYLIWTITGEVNINFTLVSGPNPVANGIFFGTSSTNPPPTTAGAYFTEQIPGGGGLANNGKSTATLTLPAGTYLITANANFALVSATASGLYVVCLINNGANVLGTLVLEGKAPLFDSQLEGVTKQLTLTTTTPSSSITLNCSNNSGATIQLDETLSALALQSINIQ